MTTSTNEGASVRSVKYDNVLWHFNVLFHVNRILTREGVCSNYVYVVSFNNHNIYVSIQINIF